MALRNTIWTPWFGLLDELYTRAVGRALVWVLYIVLSAMPRCTIPGVMSAAASMNDSFLCQLLHKLSLVQNTNSMWLRGRISFTNITAFRKNYAYCEAKTGLLADLFWKRIKPSMYSRCCLNIPSETFSDDLHHEIWWQGGRMEPILAPADKTCIISIPLHFPLLVVLLLPLPASVWACQA